MYSLKKWAECAKTECFSTIRMLFWLGSLWPINLITVVWKEIPNVVLENASSEHVH